MSSVLVTDGHERAALAVVRSLGRAGWRAYACAPRRRSLAGASRWCACQARVPDALGTPDEFATAVARLVREWHIDALIPISEASLLALLPVRSRFPGVCLPFPPHERFRRISDKVTVLDAARAVGIEVPDQQRLGTPQDFEALSRERLHFPVVVKPGRSVSEANGHRLKLGAAYACDWDSLRAVVQRAPSEAYPLLVQRRVAGPGIGIFLLLWGGEVLAQFAHRRIREKPPEGGVSVYRESIGVDAELVARSRALLERLGWEGVAMVEYKVDAATGTPYLMEINARFWGSLQLAIDAGVDFPALLVAAASGQRPDPVSTYRLGVRSRWWWGDVDHLLTRLRRSDEESALLPDTPSRWRAIVDFLKVWHPGDRNEVFRASDPLPFARESIDWVLGRGT